MKIGYRSHLTGYRSHLTGYRSHLTALLTFIMSSLALTVSHSNNVMFECTEEQKADTFVGSVAQGSGVQSEVSSADFQNLRYQILSSDGLRISSLFAINSRTGALYTSAMIDREQVCDPDVVQCRLEFDVTVKLDVAVLKIVHVTVVILDINDNSPVFPSKELVLSISEASPKGSDYPISAAVDRDAQQDTAITYRMDDNRVFELREEKLLGVSFLKVVLLEDLDREKQSEYHLHVYATDGNTSSALTGSLSLIINVTDVNDNSPQFAELTFNLTVSEHAEVGSWLGTIDAADADAGDNGRITFQFSPATSSKVLQFFHLHPDTGNVTVRSTLEYQSGEIFQAVVVAQDHGSSPKAAQTILIITVTDAGNTPPKLSLILADPTLQNSTHLSEGVPVTWFVGTLRYEDNDEGDEGVVDCLPLNRHFSLHPVDKTGLAIKINSTLNRETDKEMIVVLSCSDRGIPSLSTQVSFTVQVVDINDNAPVFARSDYNGSVQEHILSHQNIVQVSATDQDEGINKEVTYRLAVNASNSFTIDPFTGWISLVSPVDREAASVLFLNVEAVDSGKPSLTGSAKISIVVRDVNDNTPEILRGLYTVQENQGPGTLVGHIVAADSDDGVNSQLTFQTVSDSESAFRVSESGVITTEKVFDRESRDQYTIVVSVADRGTPPLTSTATLTILITDTNDHSPHFLYPLPGNNSVTVSAKLSPGTAIARVNATDLDLNKNAQLLYIIAEGDPRQMFSIHNSSGAIFLAKRLTTSRDTNYKLTVSVQDGGQPRLHNKTYLHITVDFTNATFVDTVADLQQKYAIISGIIAGITVVIAVVVIIIIIKLRKMEPNRCPEARPKFKIANLASAEAMEVSKVRVHEMPTFKVNSKVIEVGSHSGEDGGSRPSIVSNLTSDSTPTSYRLLPTQDLHDNQPSPQSFHFLEGRQRQASEDIHSDVSGDTTNSDSGKGASDVEDASSTVSPGKLSAHHFLREFPIKKTDGAGSKLTLNSGSLGDLSQASRTCSPQTDSGKTRKMPGKVHFSLNDQSIYKPGLERSQLATDFNSISGQHQPNKNLGRAYEDKRLGQYHLSHRPGNQVRTRGSHIDQPVSLRLCDQTKTMNSVPLSQDVLAQHNWLHLGSRQQQQVPNSHALLLPPSNIHHHHVPLHQNVEEDEDDVSTTTSGSYAIDGTEDTISNSVDC